MEIKIKKAQFYIISAVIIIFIILSLASVSNYVSVKPQPTKILNLGDVLQQEGEHVLENAQYNKGNVEQNIKAYLDLFSKYLEQNTQEDFNLVIIYGDINASNITGRVFTRSSLGKVTLDVGGQSFGAQGGTEVAVNPATVHVNDIAAGKKAVNITIETDGVNITSVLPVLEDNNFMFVMTTSDGFNKYVKESYPKI